jgi:hypothetical protein
VALARPRCLYCGADLPAAAVPPAAAPGEPPPAEVPPDDRALLVLDARAVAPVALREALGLAAFEASQWAKAGILRLLRVVPAAEGDAEEARLRRLGLPVWALPAPEVAAASRPVPARGGRLVEGRLELRVDKGAVRLSSADLLVVAQGPIAREYQASGGWKRRRGAGLEPGHRVHLHRRDAVPPVELDPAGFDFGRDPGGASASLRLARWVGALAQRVRVDSSFGRVPPALGPSLRDEGVLDPAQALRRRLPAGGRRGEERLVLDNLAQFRAYSACRGVLERRRAREGGG